VPDNTQQCTTIIITFGYKLEISLQFHKLLTIVSNVKQSLKGTNTNFVEQEPDVFNNVIGKNATCPARIHNKSENVSETKFSRCFGYGWVSVNIPVVK
jgi:hypothetical protein